MISIPNEMSSIDAFAAIMTYESMQNGIKIHQSSSPLHWAQMFHNYCPGSKCRYDSGVLVKADFSQPREISFPEERRASIQTALKVYQKSGQKLDDAKTEEFGVNSDYCRYFTPFWKMSTPELDRLEFARMFKTCERHTSALYRKF